MLYVSILKFYNTIKYYNETWLPWLKFEVNLKMYGEVAIETFMCILFVLYVSILKFYNTTKYYNETWLPWLKFEVNLKMYGEVIRHLLQIYIR